MESLSLLHGKRVLTYLRLLNSPRAEGSILSEIRPAGKVGTEAGLADKPVLQTPCLQPADVPGRLSVPAQE